MKKGHRIKPVPLITDFAKEEEKLLKHWYRSGVVEKYLKKNVKAKKRFSFLDGPITANNPMGVHHGWGRTYKDLWQKYYTMKGYRQRYQNGFDAQGLWVEVEVEKELGFKSKKDIEKYGVAKFNDKCRERVAKYSQIQTEQSKRLGYFMDWENSYLTLADENNYMIWHFLKVCYENGWLYKGNDSVPWCPRCQTAISQHEMLTEDYKEVTHKAIYWKLPIEGRQREFLLVWTTTPLTIPANISVAIDPKLEYALVEGTSGDGFWVAKEAIDRIFGGAKQAVRKVIKGKELVGLRYKGPFDDLPAVAAVAKENPKTFHAVIATDPLILPITTQEGTGLVHTAVSAGSEDFKLGKKYGLPMIPVIADDATYLSGLGFLTGQNAKDHPELILNYLVEQDKKAGEDWVFLIEDYRHRYPACWRCKTELVWKVTDEWYIAMDKPSKSKVKGPFGNTQGNKKLKVKGKTLRERMIAVAKTIKWLPEFGLERELDWLANMHDWLISKKNRYWGLALPIWECHACGNFEVMGGKEELKERVIAGWSEFDGKSPHKPQIDAVKIKCSNCGAIVARIEPVGNPWLDAGIVPFSTIKNNNQGEPLYGSDRKAWQGWFPADFITESFPGQFKNWFYALIAMATVLEDSRPFKTVLGFASLLGEDGRPMHKSWGNMIEFNEGAGTIGADVMRWLYCRQNPPNNLLFGYTTATEVKRRFHLILWNSYRFFANNAAVENWKIREKSSTKILDKWILSRLAGLGETVEKHLDGFDVFHVTNEFETFVQDFSVWYIRRSRDRIGPAVIDEGDKTDVYATMYKVLTTLARFLAPVMPFMTDLIYTNLTGEASVHLSAWPKFDAAFKQPELEASMVKVREVVERIHATRKVAGIKLRQPLAEVKVSGPRFGTPSLWQLILEETNVKRLTFISERKELTVELDTIITDELAAEGKARELIRQIQEARKKAGVGLAEKVVVELSDWPRNWTEEIKRRVLAVKLDKGVKLQIKRLSGLLQ